MLDPRQLLPALVRFGEPDTPPAKREQVLQYVAYAMEQLGCTDRCATRGQGSGLACGIGKEMGKDGEADTDEVLALRVLMCLSAPCHCVLNTQHSCLMH